MKLNDKKDYLYKKEKLPTGSVFTGSVDKLFTSTTQSNEIGSALTQESLRKAIDYMKDPARIKEQLEAETKYYQSHKLVNIAFNKGVINEKEYWWLLVTIATYGMLVVSEEYYEKLKKVQIDEIPYDSGIVNNIHQKRNLNKMEPGNLNEDDDV